MHGRENVMRLAPGRFLADILGPDPRIGGAFLRLGGGCLRKDVRASRLAQPNLAQARR